MYKGDQIFVDYGRNISDESFLELYGMLPRCNGVDLGYQGDCH